MDDFGRLTDGVAPGVVHTTFHRPATPANVVTTEFSDWTTNCPECKVTAVQVSPPNDLPSGNAHATSGPTAVAASPRWRRSRGMSSPDKLVMTADQIGKFFMPQPGADPVDSIADHLQSLWDPRMRAGIVAHVGAGGAGLDALVREAVGRLKEAKGPS